MGKEKHSDEYYLKMALAEAKKGRYTTSPNPAVGCVIVRDDKILGMGYHHCAGQPHAEIMALRSAKHQVEGASVYVTLEPCSHYGRTPPCAKALVEAKVKRVIIGSSDPNPKVAGRGIKMLQDAGIEVILAQGKINKECIKLNRAFFKSIQTGRPFTILKYGMSLDGKVALSTNESKWITNNECRADVQRLRLWCDALITSHKTIVSDNPKLNIRIEDVPIKILTGLDTTLIKQPIKVILDSRSRLMPNYKLKELEPYSIFTRGENYIVVGTHEPLTDPNAVITAVAKNHDHENVEVSACSCDENEALTTVSTATKGKAGTKSTAKKASKATNKKEPSSVAATQAPIASTNEAVAEEGWHINHDKVIARGANFVVEKWSPRVFVVAVPFVKGGDGLEHASLPAVLDFLGSKSIRVAMVEAGSNLGSSFLEQGLIDECYCYIAPMILGMEAKGAFAIHEPARLSQAMKFQKCKVNSFGDNIGLVLSKPTRS